MRISPIFELGDIAQLPFPYVDSDTVSLRPVCIVSRAFEWPGGMMFFAVMITSARHTRWPDDILLEDDHARYGLPRPSILRVAKIGSVDASGGVLIGRLRDAKLKLLRDALREAMAL